MMFIQKVGKPPFDDNKESFASAEIIGEEIKSFEQILSRLQRMNTKSTMAVLKRRFMNGIVFLIPTDSIIIKEEGNLINISTADGSRNIKCILSV